MALALPGNTLPTGAVLVLLIPMFGTIFGAHFNPVVTMVIALQGKMRGATRPYVAAQLVSGSLGTLLDHAMFDLPLLHLSQTHRSGTGQWLAEAAAAFGLIATILGGLRLRPEGVPWLVGLYITAAYWFTAHWFTASTSFANPAVAMAPALTASFAGISPGDVPAFVLAQGAVARGWAGCWRQRPGIAMIALHHSRLTAPQRPAMLPAKPGECDAARPPRPDRRRCPAGDPTGDLLPG